MIKRFCDSCGCFKETGVDSYRCTFTGASIHWYDSVCEMYEKRKPEVKKEEEEKREPAARMKFLKCKTCANFTPRVDVGGKYYWDGVCSICENGDEYERKRRKQED